MQNETIETKSDTLTLFAAVYRPTGDFWNFRLMDWATYPPCSQCFTSNPDVVEASWGDESADVEIREYKLTLHRVFREKKGKS